MTGSPRFAHAPAEADNPNPLMPPFLRCGACSTVSLVAPHYHHLPLCRTIRCVLPVDPSARNLSSHTHSWWLHCHSSPILTRIHTSIDSSTSTPQPTLGPLRDISLFQSFSHPWLARTPLRPVETC